MRYTELNIQSAEYLRLVIPLISKHNLAANPVSYTVWYEYVSGSNKPLTQKIDALLEKGETITNQLMDALYNQYIFEFDEARMKRLQGELGKVFSNLSESVSQVDQDASHFNQSLQDYGRGLAGETTESPLHSVVAGLLSDTQVMQASTSALHTQLEESKREIDILRDELQQTKEETLTDPLTGLTNRKGFSKAIEEAISDTTTDNYSLCLLMVDIDHFKRVNDIYGHVLGDKVIQIVATTLKNQIKGKDTAARYGGEEFAVILLDTPVSGACSVAETIRTSVENVQIKRLKSEEPIDRVTVSIGIGQYRTRESIDDFIARADAALYQSKNAGRNRVTVDPQ